MAVLGAGSVAAPKLRAWLGGHHNPSQHRNQHPPSLHRHPNQRQHRSQRRLPLAPVSPSRLHATQERCRSLLQALQHELPILEQALAGTGTRVMLTDDKGIVLHVSPTAMRPHDERVGLNMSEQAMGTSAPGIVAATGQACTVTNGEHYFEDSRKVRENAANLICDWVEAKR